LLGLLNAFITVCNTVAYAHSRGVIHRDLKGQNVVMGDFGEVVVLDWGLAKLMGRSDGDEHTSDFIHDDSGGEASYTVQGEALGTPAYMAPEQAAGRLDLIDHRTDVYGLGAILYEILAGQAPFTGSRTDEVLRKVREEEPVPPHQIWPEVPSILQSICLRALAKRPGDRYFAASDLSQQVQQWQEEELRKSRQLLQAIADHSTAVIFAKDTQGRYILVSRWFERIFHLRQEEIVGKTDLDLFSRELAEIFQTNDRRVLEAGKPLEFEELAPHDDGMHTYISLKFPIRDANGEPYAVCGISTDITDRKRAEEALRESEERYRSVISVIQDGIVLLDADGTIRACNASAERILGRSADQLIGRMPLDPLWGAICEDGSPFPDAMRPVVVTLRTGQPCSNVIMGVRRPDDSLVWLSVASQPLFHSGQANLTGIVLCFAEITGRKQFSRPL
jgi:serine/threonine-protein kinase